MANDTRELNDAAEQLLFWIRLMASTLALALVLFGRRWILIRLAAFRLAIKRIDGVDCGTASLSHGPKSKRSYWPP